MCCHGSSHFEVGWSQSLDFALLSLRQHPPVGVGGFVGGTTATTTTNKEEGRRRAKEKELPHCVFLNDLLNQILWCEGSL